MHGGERIANVLAAQGVRFVFTLCGGHISPILTAAKARGLRVIDVRHEATAVFAADAVARLTGVPGVAAVTAGPGLTNTITAIKNAQLAQSPVVILGGAAPTALQGRGALQDIDQRALIAPHVKEMWRVRRVRDLSPALCAAFSTALRGVPGPVFVECPVDLLYPEATIREWYAAAAGKGRTLGERALKFYLDRHVGRMLAGASSATDAMPSAMRPDVPQPSRPTLAKCLEHLDRSERPLLVVGSQTLTLAQEAQQVASAIGKLGIPTYLSGMARGLLGREHALQLRHERRAALKESDCVILAGVPCDFRLDYGRHVRRGAVLVSANRSRRDARMNRRPDVLAEADAGEFLRALAAARGEPSARWSAWLAQLRVRDETRERQIGERAAVTGARINPLALCRAIDHAAADNAVMVADGGDFVATASYVLRPRAPLSWLDPGVFGTLGVGAGFALGAKLCRPDAEVWILFGDGACGYGLMEFDTFVRHGIPIVAVVGNDGGWTQIAREQIKLLGDDVATVLGPVAYHAVVEGFGARGLELRDPATIGSTLQSARSLAAAGKPVLVNAYLDATDFREGSISM